MLREATDLTWLDRWFALRNRLLASARFRRWATRFPPTRPIARRRARRLFDLCAGFVYSQVLLACVRLGVLDQLSSGPQSISVLAEKLALSIDATTRLLKAAASLDLVAHRGGERFALGEMGAVLLGSPAVIAMIEHHSLLYADLADPVALLRGERPDTELARHWPYAGAGTPGALEGEAVAAYSALMAASQPLVAEQILDAHPLRAHRCLLDVGGGDGTFLAAVAEREPGLRLMLFDLPAVAARARERLAARGLTERVAVFEGDFGSTALPTGADVISLVRVVHDHDDERALALLRAVRRVLPEHGLLLLAEPMSGTQGAEAMGDAYFGFYLLAMGSGRARSPKELEALLRAADFAEIRLVPTAMPLQTCLMVARPAAPGVR